MQQGPCAYKGPCNKSMCVAVFAARCYAPHILGFQMLGIPSDSSA